MSSVSVPEAGLLVWEQGGFSRGSEERLWPRLDAPAAANYPTSCGPMRWLSVKRGGQLSHQLRAIWAIALDKR